jgi:hypothetical protein
MVGKMITKVKVELLSKPVDTLVPIILFGFPIFFHGATETVPVSIKSRSEICQVVNWSCWYLSV